MAFVIDDALTAIGYTVIGGVIGIVFMAIGVVVLQFLAERLTKKIDDEKELLRGNVAVANYNGRIIEGMLIGMAIIIAAAIIAGIHG
jgi:hypothetical protein